MSTQKSNPATLTEALVNLLIAAETAKGQSPEIVRAAENARAALQAYAALESASPIKHWTPQIASRRADVVLLDFYQAESLEDLAEVIAASPLEMGAAYYYGGICFVALSDIRAELMGEITEEWAVLVYGLWLGIHSPRIFKDAVVDASKTREYVLDLATRLHMVEAATIVEMRSHFYRG